ncbi:hypothetical protein Tco_0615875 [Tanacetum coccineum]
MEMKGGGVSFPNFLMIRYGSCQVKDSVWSERYSEWCNENSHDEKPRPRDYTFKEWVKLKKGHLDINWWYDYWYEDEEKTELGSEDYNPPMVHTETFEVTKYKLNNGCSFICVSGDNNETLSLGRKNGSRFKKMIMEEMEEVLGNDGEDFDDETIQQLGGNYRDRLDLKLCGNLVESAARIKSLREDGDNLKDFRQIPNLKAMPREFLVLILLLSF